MSTAESRRAHIALVGRPTLARLATLAARHRFVLVLAGVGLVALIARIYYISGIPSETFASGDAYGDALRSLSFARERAASSSLQRAVCRTTTSSSDLAAACASPAPGQASPSTAVPDRARPAHSSDTQRFTSSPSPSILVRTTCPAFKKTGGLRPAPTPLGVPVAITSPGSNVKIWLR